MGLALVFFICVVLALGGLILITASPKGLFWNIVTKLTGTGVIALAGWLVYFLLTNMR